MEPAGAETTDHHGYRVVRATGQRPPPGPAQPVGGFDLDMPKDRMCLGLLIISIIGLVIAFSFPWVILDSEEVDESAWYDRNLERIDEKSGEDADEVLINSNLIDYYDWDLAGAGLIMAIVFSSILIALSMVRTLFERLMEFIIMLMGVLLVFSSTMVMLSAMRTIGGLMVTVNLNPEVITQSTYYTPAPVGVVCVASLMLGMSILIVWRGMKRVSLAPDRPISVDVYARPPGGEWR